MSLVATEVIEVDITEHDLAEHRFVPKRSSRGWYLTWNKAGNCPVCHVPSKFVSMPRDEALAMADKEAVLIVQPHLTDEYALAHPAVGEVSEDGVA